MTHKEIIIQYAHDCLEDKIPSCVKHKNFCRRLLRDFERSEADPDYPYYWDEKSADLIVKWFALLRHQKGELAGQPINLTPWQQSHICQLYGWKQKENHRRRFRKMFIEVARKNAKSQELAGIILFDCAVLSTQNREIAEIYTAATKREQSRVVTQECENMLKGSPLRKKFKITNNRIEYIKNGSFIKPLSKDDGKNGDGSNPAVLVLDEYHQHPTTEFYDLSIGSNTKQPLLAVITTAGYNLNYPAYDEYLYCSRVLDPYDDLEDEIYLIDICEQDQEEADDYELLKDERLWIKSNPIRATYPEGIQHIHDKYDKALISTKEMTKCLTKNFDVWMQEKPDSYMNMAKWKACEVPELPFDIQGMECVVGVDMSSKIDLTSIAICIPFKDPADLDVDGQPIEKYIVMQHSFIPNSAKLRERELSDKFNYTAALQAGLLTVTNTETVGQAFIMKWTIDFCKKLGLKINCWACDSWNCAMFMQTLSDDGYTVYDVSQNYSSLSDPTKSFRENVYEKRIIYTPDMLMNFCMVNAIVQYNGDQIKIDKRKKTERIDIIDALINAFKLARCINQIAASQKRMEASIDAWLSADW